jgi:hypothetical protein
MYVKKIILMSFIVMIASLSAEVITIQLTAEQPRFEQGIPLIQGCNKLQIPGTPILPAQSTLLALPAGSEVISVDVSVGTPQTLVAGELPIAPPSLPLCDDRKLFEQAMERYEHNKQYLTSCTLFPAQPFHVSKMSHFRTIPFVRITYFPVLYAPTGLSFYPSIHLTIQYTTAAANNTISQWVQKDAERLFANWSAVKNLYTTVRDDSFSFVIITKDNLFSAFDSLVVWKDSLGFTTKCVSYDSIIAQYPGAQNADKIRNFLIDKYIPWGIHYVLIGGNVNQIPMKICYPDPGHSSDSYTPTDYYYAELTDDWDSDGDNYYGEYDQDSIGFVPEVIVGRFPYNDLATLSSIVQKTVNFERDTGAWKNNALLIAAFNNFEGESGLPICDGAALMEVMKDSLLNGWNYTRGYEEEGVCPSIYTHEFALTQSNVVSTWSSGQFAITNWSGHGNADGAYRKWWAWDDGDSIPEGNEIQSGPFIYISNIPSLNDTYPSIVFAASCSNAEGNDNIARSLIGNGGAGVIAATTYGWYTPAWDDPSDGNIMSLNYYFHYYLIQENQPVGDALFSAKLYYFNYIYFPDPYGGDPEWTCQQNMLDYTLFGDPSLVREGVIPGVAEYGDGDGAFSTIQFYPSLVSAHGTITYMLPCDGIVSITLFNSVGQRIETLHTGKENAGCHTIALHDAHLARGVYFIRVQFEGGGQSVTGRDKIIIY